MTRLRPHVAPPETKVTTTIHTQAHAAALRESQAVIGGSGPPSAVMSGVVMNRLRAVFGKRLSQSLSEPAALVTLEANFWK